MLNRRLFTLGSLASTAAGALLSSRSAAYADDLDDWDSFYYSYIQQIQSPYSAEIQLYDGQDLTGSSACYCWSANSVDNATGTYTGSGDPVATATGEIPSLSAARELGTLRETFDSLFKTRESRLSLLGDASDLGEGLTVVPGLARLSLNG